MVDCCWLFIFCCARVSVTSWPLPSYYNNNVHTSNATAIYIWMCVNVCSIDNRQFLWFYVDIDGWLFLLTPAYSFLTVSHKCCRYKCDVHRLWYYIWFCNHHNGTYISPSIRACVRTRVHAMDAEGKCTISASCNQPFNYNILATYKWGIFSPSIISIYSIVCAYIRYMYEVW